MSNPTQMEQTAHRFSAYARAADKARPATVLLEHLLATARPQNVPVYDWADKDRARADYNFIFSALQIMGGWPLERHARFLKAAGAARGVPDGLAAHYAASKTLLYEIFDVIYAPDEERQYTVRGTDALAEWPTSIRRSKTGEIIMAFKNASTAKAKSKYTAEPGGTPEEEAAAITVKPKRKTTARKKTTTKKKAAAKKTTAKKAAAKKTTAKKTTAKKAPATNGDRSHLTDDTKVVLGDGEWPGGSIYGAVHDALPKKGATLGTLIKHAADKLGDAEPKRARRYAVQAVRIGALRVA